MSQRNFLRRLLFTDSAASKRRQRAELVRKRALSPLRILVMVLFLPVTTVGIAIGVYMRTSEFEREEAVLHLIALAGCSTVEAIVPGPFYRGHPGYHPRNDHDGNGVACEGPLPIPGQSSLPTQAEPPAKRSVGNAKFLRSE